MEPRFLKRDYELPKKKKYNVLIFSHNHLVSKETNISNIQLDALVDSIEISKIMKNLKSQVKTEQVVCKQVFSDPKFKKKFSTKNDNFRSKKN